MAFLVFEGLDGSGKSTLIQNLKRELERRGEKVLLTREPGGTPLGEELRTVLLKNSSHPPSPRTEVLLYEAIRAEHVERVILPARAQGKWILCDRFFASTIAFQVFGRGLQQKDTEWLNHYATQGLQPDLTIFVEVSAEVSQSRVQSRVTAGGAVADRFENEEKAFHQRVEEGYRVQAREQAQGPSPWLCLKGESSPEGLVHAVIEKLTEKKWLP